MITWFQLWPLLIFPLCLMWGLGLLPEIPFHGYTFSGAAYQLWLLDHSLSLILSSNNNAMLLNWLVRASSLQQLMLHSVICLNLYCLLLPILYALGRTFIILSAWHSAKDLQLKQQAIK